MTDQPASDETSEFVKLFEEEWDREKAECLVDGCHSPRKDHSLCHNHQIQWHGQMSSNATWTEFQEFCKSVAQPEEQTMTNQTEPDLSRLSKALRCELRAELICGYEDIWTLFLPDGTSLLGAWSRIDIADDACIQSVKKGCAYRDWLKRAECGHCENLTCIHCGAWHEDVKAGKYRLLEQSEPCGVYGCSEDPLGEAFCERHSIEYASSEHDSYEEFIEAKKSEPVCAVPGCGEPVKDKRGDSGSVLCSKHVKAWLSLGSTGASSHSAHTQEYLDDIRAWAKRQGKGGQMLTTFDELKELCKRIYQDPHWPRGSVRVEARRDSSVSYEVRMFDVDKDWHSSIGVALPIDRDEVTKAVYSALVGKEQFVGGMFDALGLRPITAMRNRATGELIQAGKDGPEYLEPVKPRSTISGTPIQLGEPNLEPVGRGLLDRTFTQRFLNQGEHLSFHMPLPKFRPDPDEMRLLAHCSEPKEPEVLPMRTECQVPGCSVHVEAQSETHRVPMSMLCHKHADQWRTSDALRDWSEVDHGDWYEAVLSWAEKQAESIRFQAEAKPYLDSPGTKHPIREFFEGQWLTRREIDHIKRARALDEPSGRDRSGLAQRLEERTKVAERGAEGREGAMPNMGELMKCCDQWAARNGANWVGGPILDSQVRFKVWRRGETDESSFTIDLRGATPQSITAELDKALANLPQPEPERVSSRELYPDDEWAQVRKGKLRL